MSADPPTLEAPKVHGPGTRKEATKVAGQDYTCQMCGAKFKSQTELDQHNKTEHAGTPSEPSKTGGTKQP
jgi:hypothetical protein